MYLYVDVYVDVYVSSHAIMSYSSYCNTVGLSGGVSRLSCRV